MVSTITSWRILIDRGPGWLFVKLRPPDSNAVVDELLATEIWEALDAHLTYRLVLDLVDVRYLPSALIGQLVLLQKRVHAHDGVLRLCGLSQRCRESLRMCRLDDGLPSYEDRMEAVLGHAPSQPR